MRRRLGWLIAAVAVIAIAVVIVATAGTRPTYDPYGWLAWGHQTLYGSLNTDGAPSFKPLPFLFTLPYAWTGRTQLWLWMATAVAISLAGVVFAGRIAYALTARVTQRRAAKGVAALVAGLCLLAIRGYSHNILAAESDTMVVSLCLAAIDRQLAGRRRSAFLLLLLACFGRPEVWPFLGLYAIWTAGRSTWSERAQLAAGLAAVPAAWFIVPAFTAKTWLVGSQLAMGSPRAIHGDKIEGTISRFVHLHALPVHVAALAAVAIAVARRDRAPLLLTGAAIGWVLVEIAFALHGWSAVPRYLFEPAAAEAVLAGAAAGYVLASSEMTLPAALPARLLSAALVLVLIVALVPVGRHRITVERADLVKQRGFARQIDRLHAVIARDGGAAQVLACGHPVTLLGYQSTLAWELGLNVGNVGYRPGREIRRGVPVVVFKPHMLGWQVRTFHTAAANRQRCSQLTTVTTLG